MPNPQTDELMTRLRNSAAMQRSIGLAAGADMLESAASTIADLDAAVAVLTAMERHPAGNQRTARVITTRDEALALKDGTAVLHADGRVRLVVGSGAPAVISPTAAAFMLPLTVIHEGASA